jgi:hypothetical protein
VAQFRGLWAAVLDQKRILGEVAKHRGSMSAMCKEARGSSGGGCRVEMAANAGFSFYDKKKDHVNMQSATLLFFLINNSVTSALCLFFFWVKRRDFIYL